MPDQECTALGVEIGLGERERLADPQPGAPEHHDYTTEPEPVWIVTGGVDDSDDLLDGRRAPAPLGHRCSGGEQQPAVSVGARSLRKRVKSHESRVAVGP